MEDRENENVTTIVQFRTQLVHLRNSFLGIPLEDRTTAALAVRSLLDELLRVCRSIHSVDQNSNTMSQDSAGQISNFIVSLSDSESFDNTQLSNVSRQTCNFADQEKSLPGSTINSINGSCLEKKDCEVSSLVLTTKCSQMTDCSSLTYPEINKRIIHDNSQAVNTPCENKSTSICDNEPIQLLYDINCQTVDILVSQQTLPDVLPASGYAVTNDCAEERNKEENSSTTATASQEPYPALCMEEKLKLMDLCRRSDSDNCSEEREPKKDQILHGIGVSTTLTLPLGRITRSMARINHRKQKVKSQSNRGNIKSKRKVDPKCPKLSVGASSGELQDITSAITENELVSKLKDISNVQESGQDMMEYDKSEPAAKKLKTVEDRKKTVKSGKCAKMKRSEKPTCDASSACLLIRASGMVSCRQCRLEFKNYRSFNKHTCKSDKRVFTCKHCDLYFNRPQKYQNHVNNHIRNNCKICGAQFTKREALNKHNKSEHHGLVEPEKYYHCPLCEQKFVKKSSLYAHLKEHAELKIVCMKCGAMCDREEQYSQHMAKHAEEANFHCDKCNENFLWRQQYEQHIAGHDKYKCTMCDTNFCTKKQLVKHRRMVHGIKIREEKKHECTICQKRFQRQTMLKMHVAMHNGETPLQCSICSKNYRTFKSLSKHMKTAAHLKASGQSDMKPSTLDRAFLCAECGAKFYRKQGLARHMQQLHSEDRPFECSFCDYTCKCKTNLKRHVELHKNERRFICELCGSSFHAHGTLKEHHAYVHSEDRQFVCQKCGKGFKGRSGLRRHIRSHSDNRPFVCYCGQSYKRMSHLKRHMMSIHGIAFKSKRVQRIGSDDQCSSTYDDSNPSTHFQYVESMTDITPVDSALQAQTITLPVTATNGLLIIDNPLQGTQEMAQSMTLEVTDVVTRMEMPQLITETMTTVDQLGVQNSTIIPLLPATNEHMSNSCMLPSIMDTVDLNQSFNLGSVSIPISQCSISEASPLPSLNPQTIYHTVQNLDSALAFPLQSSITELTNPAVQTLPPEFYTQSLAQYMACNQPELI